MNDAVILLFGFGVFTLLLTGLYLSAREFLKASDRPNLIKGKNVAAVQRQRDRDAA